MPPAKGRSLPDKRRFTHGSHDESLLPKIARAIA